MTAVPAVGQTSSPFQVDLNQALKTVQTQAESPERAAQEKELQAAQQLLSNTAASKVQAEAFRTAAEAEMQTIATIDETSSRLKTEPVKTVPTSPDEQSQALSEAESLLATKRNALQELTNQKTNLSGRASAISKDLATLQASLDEQQTQPASDNAAASLIANITLADFRQ
ncbi:hypothetical protein N9M10_05455, partial [Hellea sp.]|nr:hypothetical protein [Hellea sp.]